MNTNDSTEDLFGPAIHTYSRAQAIADGALIDLTAKAKEHGVSMPFKFPPRLHRGGLGLDRAQRR